jgi:hypothetical protein
MFSSAQKAGKIISTKPVLLNVRLGRDHNLLPNPILH